MRFYFDTSALVPLYVPESASSQSAERLRRATSVCVSWLAEVEFRFALALKTRTKALAPEPATTVLRAFQRHLDQRLYQLLPMDRGVFAQAVLWLEQLSTPLRCLDALHLACCHREQCVLVTLDAALARSARRLGVPCDFIGAD
ncbi:MAG: PIN domain-containing protein [Candidatus Dadabacteria bacterium]|nr:MAG: PIN domain-containing protein [Candidatus Dadabacteria bacterium]